MARFLSGILAPASIPPRCRSRLPLQCPEPYASSDLADYAGTVQDEHRPRPRRSGDSDLQFWRKLGADASALSGAVALPSPDRTCRERTRGAVELTRASPPPELGSVTSRAHRIRRAAIASAVSDPQRDHHCRSRRLQPGAARRSTAPPHPSPSPVPSPRPRATTRRRRWPEA